MFILQFNFHRTRMVSHDLMTAKRTSEGTQKDTGISNISRILGSISVSTNFLRMNAWNYTSNPCVLRTWRADRYAVPYSKTKCAVTYWIEQLRPLQCRYGCLISAFFLGINGPAKNLWLQNKILRRLYLGWPHCNYHIQLLVTNI